MTEYVQNEAGILVPMAVGGVFEIEHIREGEVIDKWRQPNLVVNEGLNKLLDVMFHADTQIATWYLGLFEGNYTPVAGLTAATVASASTECTAYDNATRPEFNEAIASGQSITNSANRASFVFNATKTIYGAFLISDNTKGGSSGSLFAAARFASAKAVVSSDELLLTYTFSASSV